MEIERGMRMVVEFWQKFLMRPEVNDIFGFWMGLVFFVILGAGMGSFVCCQVRRMRLVEEGKALKSSRSKCLHCGYTLKWYDNIPIVSWLVLRGKCRKCRKKIGVMEILSEVIPGMGFGILFMFAYEKDLLMIILSVILAVFLLILLGLSLYDAKWKVVPEKMLIMLILAGMAFFVVRVVPIFMADLMSGVWQVVVTIMGVSILSGVYYLLYKGSKEKMVGAGDWMVGLGMALVLGQPMLAILTMFLANFCGVVIYAIFLRKKGREVPMVPFLAVGFLLGLVVFQVLLTFKLM